MEQSRPDFIKEAEELTKVKEEFSLAFKSIKNATITKRQKSLFAFIMYPLYLVFGYALLAMVIAVSIIISATSVVDIIGLVIIGVGVVILSVLIIRTLYYVIKNAKLVERIYYQNISGEVTIVSFLDGGATKAEWKDASIYFYKDGSAEMIDREVKNEGKASKYKTIRSANYKVLNLNYLLKKYFSVGRVLSREGGATKLSSGLSFTTIEGQLTSIIIEKAPEDCYEQNFPLSSVFLPSPSSYDYYYDFSAINDPSFVQRFPKGTGPVAKLFKLSLPKENCVVYEESGEEYELPKK